MAAETVMTVVPEDNISFWADELREALDKAEEQSEEPAIFVHLEDGRQITGFRLVIDSSDGETSIILTIG